MPQRETASIIQCGREITNQELDEIQETVKLFPRLSRTELAQTICEHLGWMMAVGSYKVDACLKLLEKLEAKGTVRLPAKRVRSRPKQSESSIPLTVRTQPRNISKNSGKNKKILDKKDFKCYNTMYESTANTDTQNPRRRKDPDHFAIAGNYRAASCNYPTAG